MFSLDHDAAAGGLYRAGLGVGKARPSRDDPHLGLAQKPAHAAAQPIDDTVFPAHGLVEAQAWRLAQSDAEPPRLPRRRHGFLIEAGGVDQGLGRNAAARQAGAAQTPDLDQNRVEPQLSGANGGHIAARSPANDEDLGSEGLGHRISP
ncbi:hypothetical protein D3C80_1433090 [compost metagenome]